MYAHDFSLTYNENADFSSFSANRYVFISSTFRDMHGKWPRDHVSSLGTRPSYVERCLLNHAGERDVLTRDVFPALNDRCRSLNVNVVRSA